MSMTEKKSLINEITLKFAEDYNLKISEVKNKLNDILKNYHITMNDESFCGENQTTEYLLKKFADGKSAIGMSEKTLKQYKIAVKKLEEICRKSLAEIETNDFNNFMKIYGEQVTSVTLKCKFQLLSSVFNYLYNHHYITFNPIAYITPPKATVIYKNPMSDLELEKLKKACEKLPEKESLRNMAILYFLLSSGCRVSEICNIKIGDIDFNTKSCKVLGKGKKERPIVITDKTLYRLQLYLDTRKTKNANSPLFAKIRGEETKLTKDSVLLIIKKLSKIAGVKKITCHTFRRYYATELRKRNVPVQMIANSLGHANLNQINRYSLFGSNELLQTVRNAL